MDQDRERNITTVRRDAARERQVHRQQHVRKVLLILDYAVECIGCLSVLLGYSIKTFTEKIVVSYIVKSIAFSSFGIMIPLAYLLNESRVKQTIEKLGWYAGFKSIFHSRRKIRRLESNRINNSSNRRRISIAQHNTQRNVVNASPPNFHQEILDNNSNRTPVNDNGALQPSREIDDSFRFIDDESLCQDISGELRALTSETTNDYTFGLENSTEYNDIHFSFRSQCRIGYLSGFILRENSPCDTSLHSSAGIDEIGSSDIECDAESLMLQATNCSDEIE